MLLFALVLAAVWLCGPELQAFLPSIAGGDAACRSIASTRTGLSARSGAEQAGAALPALASPSICGCLGLLALASWGARRSRGAVRSAALVQLRAEPVDLPNGFVSVEETAIGYARFMPRFYNWCKSLGMTPGRMLPSIGFCADENQGYATTLILKHFGTWPFNHGYIGGILALDRHGPHAAHGEDMVIFCAPHVGYDPETKKFGTYRRSQVVNEDQQFSTCCGKIAGVLSPYQEQYEKTLGRIRVKIEGDSTVLVSLSDSISRDATDGHYLCIEYDEVLAPRALENPRYKESTATVYEASERFAGNIREALAVQSIEEKRQWQSLEVSPLREALSPYMFYFMAPPLDGEEHRLERLLLPNMPLVLNGPWAPDLMCAVLCCQAEFGRAVHSVEYEPSYKGKNLVVVSGVNIDCSPSKESGSAFPSTVFLPWAAYAQLADGTRRVLEQEDFVKEMAAQSEQNSDAIDIEDCIEKLFKRKKAEVVFDSAN